MPGKLSGVFDCETVAEHRLLRGADEPWRAPHSRCNGLREADLRARGYRIVTRAGEAGVDMFVKRRGSLFVFLQSHPEYDAGALYREYRRDVGRFLAGERRVYPEIPSPYLDAEATARLLAFRARVTASGHPNLMAEFPAIAPERHLLRPWRQSAVKLYANWLRYLDERRAVRAGAVWNRVTSLTKPDGVAAVV
jgi:homoserine O-succinyltransferase